MKATKILEYSFYFGAIGIAFFVVGLNCIQSSGGPALPGVFACDYGLTSADPRVKVGGAVILVLFVALVFGPVLAAVQRSARSRRPERRTQA